MTVLRVVSTTLLAALVALSPTTPAVPAALTATAPSVTTPTPDPTATPDAAATADDEPVVPDPQKSAPPPNLDALIADAKVDQAEDLERDLQNANAFHPQPVPFVPGSPVGPQTVQCYGDSILGSVCGGGAPTSPLPQALGGWTTLDRSLGGHWSSSIAVQAGAYRMQLVDQVTIAASGDTSIPEPYLAEVPADSIGGLTIPVSIGGVEGTLIQRPDLGIRWRFTRYTPGDAVQVGPGTPIVSLGAMLPGASSIIWAGTNNLTATTQILADVDAMVKLHQSISDQPFWVVSLTPAWGNSGSIYGIARKEVNRQLEERYGDHYIPVDEYIGNGALTDAGIMPTSDDRTWIDSGLNPPSFHSSNDWVHFNRTGQEAIARFLTRFVRDGSTRAAQRALFDAQAALQVSVNGASVQVSGWAFDPSDLYQRIPVGITIDDKWMLATFADGPSPELARYGVPGGHGFRWSTTIADGGSHKVCIVGVGIGAGQNAYPPCHIIETASLLPQGDMSLVDVGDGTMAIVGWGFDHADLYAHIPVGIIIDGGWFAGITAQLESPYLRPYGVPGDHAFFQGAHVGSGTHSVCAVGVSAATGRNAILKCESIVLR